MAEGLLPESHPTDMGNPGATGVKTIRQFTCPAAVVPGV
jgi:hypothetical protein